MSAKHRVLFVCEANICRSALMETVFVETMPAERWCAASAGTNVVVGEQGMCSVSAEFAGPGVGSHASVQLERHDIERSHLVVTASRAERAEAAALAPGMRWKIFTLRELNFLAARFATTKELSPFAGGSRRVDDLERYAILLHGRRGLAPSPEPRRWRFGSKARAHPFDVDDVHGRKLSVHRAALDELVRDVQLLAAHLSTAVPGRTS